MKFRQWWTRLTRPLNTHFVANIGSGLAGIGLSVQSVLLYPGASDALKLVGVPANTVTSINAGSLIAIAIGAALNRYGRPESIPKDPTPQTPPMPAAPAKGNQP